LARASRYIASVSAGWNPELCHSKLRKKCVIHTRKMAWKLITLVIL